LAAGFRRANIDPPSFTAEELLTQMKPSGAAQCVLIQMSFYGWDNRYMLDCIQRYKGRFSGVAVIDQDQPAPEAEMDRLKALGVRGFRVYPQNQTIDRWLDTPGLPKMFAHGAKERLAICCLIDANALPALSRYCEKYPDTPVVIDHLARIGVTGQIPEADVALLCGMAKHKQVTVKVSAFYALGRKQPPYLDLAPLIKRVYDAFGPQRLMWATDCPFQVVEHRYQESIDLILKGLDFLTDDDRAWMLRKTAEKVFFEGIAEPKDA
jgi:predicted TIM-barrel fold metal-dependent hydrolase